jgi:hypothetical protein
MCHAILLPRVGGNVNSQPVVRVVRVHVARLWGIDNNAAELLSRRSRRRSLPLALGPQLPLTLDLRKLRILGPLEGLLGFGRRDYIRR